MSDISSSNWSEIDAGNNATPPEGWPEGQYPSTVNDCARADKGGIKRFWDRINPVQTITPASGLWTFTTGNPTYPAAYVNGEVYSFKAGAASAAGDQFKVNSLAALPIYVARANGVINAILPNDIVGGWHPVLVYDATLASGAGGFLLTNPLLPAYAISGGLDVPGTLTVAGTATFGNVTVGGTLGVAGAATLSSTLGVAGAANFSGNVTVGSGSTDLTVSVGGVVDIAGPGGAVNFIDRVNTSNAWGMFSSGNTLDWSYNATGPQMTLGPGGALNVTGAVTFQNTLGVSGTGTFSGTLNAATLGISGNATISGTLGVGGNVTHSGVTILGAGGQTTTLPLNVNGSGTAAQISAVSGSALNLRLDNGGPLLYMLYQSSTNVGTITTNGSSVTYNTTSDARLKENVTPIDPAFLEQAIAGLQPVEFDWISNGLHDWGFIAQDVEDVFPAAVTPGQGEPGDEDFQPYQISTTALIPLLLAELQALRARVANLEAARDARK